jgi:hypothetical protein
MFCLAEYPGRPCSPDKISLNVSGSLLPKRITFGNLLLESILFRNLMPINLETELMMDPVVETRKKTVAVGTPDVHQAFAANKRG